MRAQSSVGRELSHIIESKLVCGKYKEGEPLNPKGFFFGGQNSEPYGSKRTKPRGGHSKT